MSDQREDGGKVPSELFQAANQQVDTLLAVVDDLRPDAEEFRALGWVIAHPQRHQRTTVAWSGHWTAYLDTGDGLFAVFGKVPTQLRAAFEAEAARRAPRAEVWRWVGPSGDVPHKRLSSAAEARMVFEGYPGQPMREVRNRAGNIMLLVEGQPVPEGWA